MPIPSLSSTQPVAPAAVIALDQGYEHEETRELVALVNEAAKLVRTRGEAAFGDFRIPDSRWRHGETYVFVLDREGNVVVHPEPGMEGTNQIDLLDANGKPIIRGLIEAATLFSDKPEGWYHYQWPAPRGIFPRWKSSYVRLVRAPSGTSYIVGAGMYNDRMERAFVVDAVASAVHAIEELGQTTAFLAFIDPRGPFISKDAYIFVMDATGVELVNPAFPDLEGRSLLDMRDTAGKDVVREMLQVIQTRGSGWVDYMWPKPGDSVSTQKSAYVSKAKLADQTFVVGCGVYLADAPVEARPAPTMTAPELMALVRQAAALLEQQGEQAYSVFRERDSRWLGDSTYVFVLRPDGIIAFHAADPSREGQQETAHDVRGRPIGKLILDVGASASGEGWVHYMYPAPGSTFPAWKSTFCKRVTFPSGKPHIVCSGIYNMQLDRTLIEDVVDRAAALIAERGQDAFAQLRDRTGPFMFMDTFVYVERPDGTELVNPAQPSLEGKNLRSMKDVTGRAVVQDEIAAAMRDGSAWLECYWFKPGDNRPARKETYVRKVQSGDETFIVGAGIYVP